MSGTARPLMSSQLVTVAVSSDKFLQLIEAIKCSQVRMDEKLARFQIKVRQGQDKAPAKALKRSHCIWPGTFRKKFNEAQATFKTKIDRMFIQTEIKVGSIIQQVLEAMQWTDEQQKLIRLASSSKHRFKAFYSGGEVHSV